MTSLLMDPCCAVTAAIRPPGAGAASGNVEFCAASGPRQIADASNASRARRPTIIRYSKLYASRRSTLQDLHSPEVPSARTSAPTSL